MDWWQFLIIYLGGLLLMIAIGLPVAFAFLLVNFTAGAYLMGGDIGANQLVLSIFNSITNFSLVPIPLFVLMGEILFHSGLALCTLDVLSKWLGRVPGRLGVLSIISGGLFATLSGSTMANTAMLGTILVPEMSRRGYSKLMSLGPILGSGGLAMIIPPSALAVLLGSLANISIGKLLIAGIIPGLVLIIFYLFFIIAVSLLLPALAPGYAVEPSPWKEKISDLMRHVLPLGTLVFLAIGLIFLGVATPTEAAALGAVGSLVLAAAKGLLTKEVMQKALAGTMRISVMTLMIVAGSAAFSQILAFSGASRELVQTVLDLPLAPMLLVIAMQLIVLVMGCFMEQVSIMMITLPMFMPVINALGFDPVWFGMLMLINLEIAMISPPFGLMLFVMKGVAPPDTKMSDIYKSALPFILCDLAVMALIMIFPSIATWLPRQMHS